MSRYLSDPEYLFSILTAIVKKSGGKIKLTDQEMKSVSKGDLIGMYFEPETGTLILKEVETKDMMQATTIIRDKKGADKVYDN
tara:strand:+ start:114 stop:362 length:249 start_codon:yes stop_codon:yes gene_type:complete